MFDLRLVFKRLQDEVSILDFIGDGIDLSLVKNQESIKNISAYIQLNSISSPESETGLPFSLKGKNRQFILVKFSVTLITNNPRYSSSSENFLEPTLEKIHGALIGWLPEMQTAQSCQLISGEMKVYNEKMQVWQDNYEFRYAIGRE